MQLLYFPFLSGLMSPPRRGSTISFASMDCNSLSVLIFFLCVRSLFDMSTLDCQTPYWALHGACATFQMANSNEGSKKYFWRKQSHGDLNK